MPKVIIGTEWYKPLQFCKDVNLVALIQGVPDKRSRNTAKVVEVKSHTTDDVVQKGVVSRADKVGNDAAAEAADLCRRRRPQHVLDSRRRLFGTCSYWYLLVEEVHHSFNAVVRTVVNNDGYCGTAPDPLVWSSGALHKAPTLLLSFRSLGSWLARLPCYQGSAPLMYRIGHTKLARWLSPVLFPRSSHWQSDVGNPGLEGASHFELLIQYETWAGESSVMEQAVAQIVASAVPFDPGTEKWRSCWFLGLTFRASADLPGGGKIFPMRDWR